MLKVTYKQVETMEPALKVLGEKDFPMKYASTIRRWIREIRENFSDFTAEKEKLILKFSKKLESGEVATTPKGEVLFPSGEAVREFLSALGELQAVEVDLEVKPLFISDLGEIQISPSVLDGLGDLLMEDPDPEEKHDE